MSEIICHFIILIIILMIVIISLCNGEVIKLENKTHIYCIDDDFNNKEALFVSPPLKEIQTLQNNLIWEYNNVNEWDLVNGSALGIAPITDKRWNGIPLNENNYTHFNLNTSISFSVYSPYGVEIFIYNHDQVLPYEHFDAIHKESKWYHYTVLLKNGIVHLFENNKIVDQDNFVPTDVVFRNLNKQFYFKIHQDRKFLWSNKTTEDEEPSIIKIPPTGKSCLTLYTSFCKECYLEVIYNNEKTTITSINQANNLMESWQMQRLEIKPYKENTLKIYRKINNRNSTGHWALDFSLCDLNNTVTYKKEESVDYICNSLNINFNKRAKRSSSHQEKPCPAGKLGRNCDISCQNILNSNFRYCDKHKICNKNTDCNCAWGYNGQFCNNLCEEGKWGLSCKEDCKSCTSCDKHTGECLFQPQTNSLQTTTLNLVPCIVVAVLLVVVVGVLLIIKTGLRRSQETEQNIPELSTFFQP